ncbi:hypothetical protein CBFG_00543 [Clostridiales bacterium 1_7_47FAA]|nr:hypothetical protein CBFG_00543 [Clostridiales bacterium 1_7_47FAA]
MFYLTEAAGRRLLCCAGNMVRNMGWDCIYASSCRINL